MLTYLQLSSYECQSASTTLTQVSHSSSSLLLPSISSTVDTIDSGFVSATSSFGTSSGCQPMSFTFVFSTVSYASSRFGNYHFVFGELLRTRYNFVLNSLFHTTLVLYFLFVMLLSLFTTNTSENFDEYSTSLRAAARIRLFKTN